MKRFNNLIQWLSLLVAAYAVYQELKKPEADRTWTGKVADFVPYDFRPPTLERVKERLWNPDDPSLVAPTVFGVGWSLNFAQLYKLGEYFVAGMRKEEA